MSSPRNVTQQVQLPGGGTAALTVQIGVPNDPPAEGEFADESITLEQAKAVLVGRIRLRAKELLEPTDWMASRFADTLAKPVPTNLQAARGNVRAVSNQLEAQIAAATTKAEVAAIQWHAALNGAEVILAEQSGQPITGKTQIPEDA